VLVPSSISAWDPALAQSLFIRIAAPRDDGGDALRMRQRKPESHGRAVIEDVDRVALLLLQGFPASSHMFRNLIPARPTATTWSRLTSRASDSRKRPTASGKSNANPASGIPLLWESSPIDNARKVLYLFPSLAG
jgi:hypothetical protein